MKKSSIIKKLRKTIVSLHNLINHYETHMQLAENAIICKDEQLTILEAANTQHHIEIKRLTLELTDTQEALSRSRCLVKSFQSSKI